MNFQTLLPKIRRLVHAFWRQRFILSDHANHCALQTLDANICWINLCVPCIIVIIDYYFLSTYAVRSTVLRIACAYPYLFHISSLWFGNCDYFCLTVFSLKIVNYNNNKTKYYSMIFFSLTQNNLVKHNPFKNFQLTYPFCKVVI